MNIRLSFLIVCGFIPMATFAQLSLAIQIDELRYNSGQIHLELIDENEIQVVATSNPISENKCLILIENLKPGLYAFKFFHDENNNEKLDLSWLRIPKEGFGFSNNPNMTFGPPAFEKTLFELYESKEITCKPKYY
jgi:uncharacterized protein (DUF2141 family)